MQEICIQDILRYVKGKSGLLLRAICQVNELGRLERILHADLIPLISGGKKIFHHFPVVLGSTGLLEFQLSLIDVINSLFIWLLIHLNWGGILKLGPLGLPLLEKNIFIALLFIECRPIIDCLRFIMRVESSKVFLDGLVWG